MFVVGKTDMFVMKAADADLPPHSIASMCIGSVEFKTGQLTERNKWQTILQLHGTNTFRPNHVQPSWAALTNMSEAFFFAFLPNGRVGSAHVTNEQHFITLLHDASGGNFSTPGAAFLSERVSSVLDSAMAGGTAGPRDASESRYTVPGPMEEPDDGFARLKDFWPDFSEDEKVLYSLMTMLRRHYRYSVADAKQLVLAAHPELSPREGDVITA